MSEDDLSVEWLAKLFELREQGMQVTDINPVSALADIIGDQIGSGKVTVDRLRSLLDHQAGDLWGRRVAALRSQTSLDSGGPPRFPILEAATLQSRPTVLSSPRIRSLPCGRMFRPKCAAMPILDQALCLRMPLPRASR